MSIRFYCGVNEVKWNHHPVAPGTYACISPVYGRTTRTKKENRVKVPDNTQILQDSGAFCDGPGQRLSFSDALRRQESHAKKYDYSDQVILRASYDLLIDEKWTSGIRYKYRWSENEAWEAVKETIEAARFLCKYRNGINLVLSAQGVTPKQYLECVRQVVPFFQDGDVLGLGGWCILGKMPKRLFGVFRETIRITIPYAASQGIKNIHIWGVMKSAALGELLWMCDQYNLTLSTDSAGPQLRPAAFGEWGYEGWKDRSYKRHSPKTRGLERARHVKATREWLSNLRSAKFYREPPVSKYKQLTLEGMK